MKLLQYWQQNAVSLLPLNEQSWEYWSHTILYKQTKMPWTLGDLVPHPIHGSLDPPKSATQTPIRPIGTLICSVIHFVGCIVKANRHMHMAQQMTLSVSCFSKIQIGFSFLVPAHPGSPGKKAIKRACVNPAFITVIRYKQFYYHTKASSSLAHKAMTMWSTWAWRKTASRSNKASISVFSLTQRGA